MTEPSPVLPGARVLDYPAELSTWWRDRAERHGAPPERVAAAAGRLSDGFTTERPAELSDYLGAADARLAYGWFFFPQAWVRTRFPLAELVDFRGWTFPRDRPLRVVDVGAGQGPAGLSAAQWLVARGLAESVHLTAADRSADALADLRDLHRGMSAAFPRTTLETVHRDVRAPGAANDLVEPADLVVVGFALNEVCGAGGAQAAAPWARSLLPRRGLLLVLEPATREASLRLNAVSADVLASGRGHGWGPDLLFRAADPDARYWSYESRRWDPPSTVARVNARLRRSLDELTFSYAALATERAPVVPPSPAVHRLVSQVRRPKGLVAWSGRASDGETYDYEVLARHAKADRRLFERLERGDVVTLSAWTEHAGRRIRVASPEDVASHFHPA